MNKKAQKEAPANKSILFVIEDVAKLLRSEVKKTESLFKKTIRKRRSITSSPNFVNGVEQIAKLLRTQIHSLPPQKKRGWRFLNKPLNSAKNQSK